MRLSFPPRGMIEQTSTSSSAEAKRGGRVGEGGEIQPLKEYITGSSEQNVVLVQYYFRYVKYC